MTNNDDFDHQEFDHIEETPSPQGLKANLAEAWRSQPLFKLVVLMTAVGAVVAAGVGLFSGGSNSSNVSKLVNPPSVHEAPGGAISPFMKQQTEMANAQRTKNAVESGGSALPTPMGSSTDMSEIGTEKKNDTLNELRTEIDRLRQQQTQTQQKMQQQIQQVQPRQQPGQPEQFDDSLAQAMQRQMKELMDGWAPHGTKLVSVTSADEVKKATAGGAATDASQAASGTNPATGTNGETSPAQAPAKVLVPAGTVSYGQLLIEANSDVPGPIMVQIVSGPFSGARAIGQFQIANGYADYLVLKFNLVDFKGKDFPINAIALDPNTTLGGMATDVDQRYFSRVVLPAAASFLQGFGSALGTGGSTTSTNGTTTIVSQTQEGYRQGLFQGLGQGAQTASQFLQEQANLIKPLVRVAAGTPMGIFFVTTVFDTTVQQYQEQRAAAGYPGAGALGALGAAGAGYGVNPYGANPYGTNPYGTNPYGANPYGANPYGAGAYPGTTVAGYGSGAYPPTAGVPYPNYSAPASAASSPFSPGGGTTIIPGSPAYGTTVYGR